MAEWLATTIVQLPNKVTKLQKFHKAWQNHPKNLQVCKVRLWVANTTNTTHDVINSTIYVKPVAQVFLPSCHVGMSVARITMAFYEAPHCKAIRFVGFKSSPSTRQSSTYTLPSTLPVYSWLQCAIAAQPSLQSLSHVSREHCASRMLCCGVITSQIFVAETTHRPLGTKNMKPPGFDSKLRINSAQWVQL